MRLTIRALGLAALGALVCACPASAELDEYHAKALFLYKFTRFVEWPAEAFRDPAEPLTVCILGESPLESTLAETVRGKKLDGRAFLLRRVVDPKLIHGCHLLFVGRGPGLRLFRLARTEAGARPGLLVVGESEGFAVEGGVINFKLADGRLRIEVNVTQARREKLVINSRLLSMADVVER